MVTYPIIIQRSGYRGADKRKREVALEHNRIAAELETLINEKLLIQEAPIQVYLYHEIALDSGYSESKVREMCFCIDGGHNGFTAYKHGLTYEQALEVNSRRFKVEESADVLEPGCRQ